MNENVASRISRPWKFFGLTFILTGYVGFRQHCYPGKTLCSRGTLLFAVGVMPEVATLLLLYLYDNHPARRDYWQRLFDFRRVSIVCYTIILLAVPILTTAAIVLDVFLEVLRPTLRLLSKAAISMA